MSLPKFTVYVGTIDAGVVTGKGGVKEYMVNAQLAHLFAVRDDGQCFNAILRNGRCTMTSTQ